MCIIKGDLSYGYCLLFGGVKMDWDYHDKYFTKEEIDERFKVFEKEKTFGQVDERDVFHNQVPAKGIAGCVIEQSVLHMKQNAMQEADLSVLQSDGTYKDTELKTTGVEISNKQSEKYCAKEPMSITAVSIGTIEHEEFIGSHFYNKIAHLIFVFYLYQRNEGQKVVPYTDYEKFPILGYEFLDIADDPEELEKFENDWRLAHDYLLSIENNPDRYDLYPLLHQKIKQNLFYIDIAPRFKLKPKQSPRFRFKKSYVNTLFQQFYAEKMKKKKLEKLQKDFSSYSELDDRLHALTEQYRGKTIEELVDILHIHKLSVAGREGEQFLRPKFSKRISETIVVKMLGGTSRSISNIELFNKIGLIGKTITITSSGIETEEMKLFTMDLDEIMDETLSFENTSYYEYFSTHQILCIVFEEPSEEAMLNDNIFLGFKRLAFDETIINGMIKDVYMDICDKINNGKIVESFCYLKDGSQRINKTGRPMVSINFPKQKDGDIFVRGTGKDSTVKPWVFKGDAIDGSGIVHTYSQQIWIKGRYITNELKKIDFI
jgi:hypothetical protein